MFKFEKLDSWQLALDYADQIYRITRSFPTDERFGLTNQLRRAAVSVSANIAEGTGRTSDRDFERFIEIAYGSLLETVSHLKIAERLGIAPPESTKELLETADRLARMLTGLRNSRSNH